MRIDNRLVMDFGYQPVEKIALRVRALVLLELLIVVAIMSMMIGMATLNFSGVWGRSTFEKQAEELISVLKMAQNASAESDRRYAVILNFPEQTYTLRQYVSPDMETLPAEQAELATGQFTEQCQLEYVLFDDFDITGEDAVEARFIAGHSGWQFGGKIVLLDIDGNPYSVIINRLSRVITLIPDDVEILEPKYEEDVPF